MFVVSYLAEGVVRYSETFRTEDAAICAGCAWVGCGNYDRAYTVDRKEG